MIIEQGVLPSYYSTPKMLVIEQCNFHPLNTCRFFVYASCDFKRSDVSEHTVAIFKVKPKSNVDANGNLKLVA